MKDETPSTEQAPPKQHMMFIRPGNQDSKHAFYAPERDVSLQGLRMLGEVEKLILEDRFEPWKPVYEALRVHHGSQLPMQEELRQAGMACVEYVADCWGKTYVPGGQLVDWPQAEKRLSFIEAIEKLKAKASPAALQLILMLQGYFMMDFYFAGVGQALQIGLELDRSAQEVYSMFDAMTRRLWVGEATEREQLADFRKVVAAALQAGIRSSTLQTIIDNEVAKL